MGLEQNNMFIIHVVAVAINYNFLNGIFVLYLMSTGGIFHWMVHFLSISCTAFWTLVLFELCLKTLWVCLSKGKFLDEFLSARNSNNLAGILREIINDNLLLTCFNLINSLNRTLSRKKVIFFSMKKFWMNIYYSIYRIWFDLIWLVHSRESFKQIYCILFFASILIIFIKSLAWSSKLISRMEFTFIAFIFIFTRRFYANFLNATRGILCC